jgi:osmotically inducible protein OsmC
MTNNEVTSRPTTASRVRKETEMAAIQRSSNVVWDGTIARGAGRLSAHSGAFTALPVTVASRFGEPEGKTSPEELIAAAHATCFTMALGFVLAGHHTPPERLAVRAVITLEETGGSYSITSSELEIVGYVPGIDQAAFERAAQEAEQSCPVSRALAGSVEIRSHSRLEAPREPVGTASRAD